VGRTGDIRLARGIVDVFVWTPAALVTLDAHSSGRAIASFGVATSGVVGNLNGTECLLARIHECIQLVRQYLAGNVDSFETESLSAAREFLLSSN